MRRDLEDLRSYVIPDAGDGHPSIIVRSDADYIEALELERVRIHDQLRGAVEALEEIAALADEHGGLYAAAINQMGSIAKRALPPAGGR